MEEKTFVILRADNVLVNQITEDILAMNIKVNSSQNVMTKIPIIVEINTNMEKRSIYLVMIKALKLKIANGRKLTVDLPAQQVKKSVEFGKRFIKCSPKKDAALIFKC